MPNRLILYTGDGKGKTTAALGAAIRAAGHNRDVLIVQFLKGEIKSGEQSLFKRYEDELKIRIKSFGDGFVRPNSDEEVKKARAKIQRTLKEVLRILNETEPDMVVLDELCVVLALGLITQQDAEKLLDKALSYGHTIVTGRNAPDWLAERADTVTEMVEVRHPFRRGIPARKGVEF